MRRSTWIWWAILLAVAVLWFLLRSGRISLPASFSGTATPTLETRQLLFSADEGTINGIKVEASEGQVVEIQRGAAGTWSLLQPEIAAADPALAESAATQAAALTILTALESDTDPQLLGLDQPAYTLTLETSAGTRVFLIGSPTVTGSGYYVKTPDGQLVVVTKYGLDALVGLLSAPPYAETPTPSATLSPIGVPTASSTP
jgi:uncharacterized protein DUF4340